MKTYAPGCPARSLAGHDKDRYYIILMEDGECVMLADGKNRPVSHPKRKKKRHIQAGKTPLITEFPATDDAIRSALAQYSEQPQE